MYVPFIDLKAQYRYLKKSIDRAIDDVVENTRFIHGEEVMLFEKEFARYLGASYCIGLNSGTDALILGIRALGLSVGDEVIVPVNTFIATAFGATENSLKPIFVDCDPVDYGIDLLDLKRRITTKTKAIIVVHLYGQPDKLDEIKKIIKDTGREIHLIEDACQAHGALYKGKRVGNFGVFSAFSFYPGKNLGAYGDGGAIVTSDESLAKRVTMLREYGQIRKYYHETVGINSRLDTIQAAVLRTKLPHLDSWNKMRQKWAAYYTKRLQKELPSVKTPMIIPDRKRIFHLYVVEVSRRDGLLRFLNELGIQSLIHYPIPLHMQHAFAHLKHKKGDFPNAEKTADRIISLPMHPDLTKQQVDFVIDSIKQFYKMYA